MAARTHHPGICERRGKLWIDFPFQGKRYRELWSAKTTTTEKNKALLERKKILAAIANGSFDYAEYFPNSRHAVKTEAPTFGKLAADWLRSQMVRANTQGSYEVGMRFWNRHLEGRLIQTINHVEIRGILNTALIEGGLAKKTLNNYLVPCRGVFEDAVALDYIVKNPMDKIENFEVHFQKPEPIGNEADVERIIAELYKRNPQVGNYFGFAFHSGLRVSELIALTWEDFYPNKKPNPVVSVNKRRAYGKLEPPKNNRSRDVVLNKKALAFLEDQKQFTAFKKREIFENPNTGEPWQSDKFQRNLWWNPVLKHLGIDHNRAYCTRHTYASHLIAKDIPVDVVSRQLGHSSILITYKYYVGEVPTASEAAHKKINDLIDAEVEGEKKPSAM